MTWPAAMLKWVRTCQECFHEQEDKNPEGEPTDAYRNKLCRKCKSEGLDYGTYKTELPK